MPAIFTLLQRAALFAFAGRSARSLLQVLGKSIGLGTGCLIAQQNLVLTVVLDYGARALAGR